jgi:hypothetical protein
MPWCCGKDSLETLPTPVHHRPVHRQRAEQVGEAEWVGHAAPPRDGGNGARATIELARD